MTKGVFFKYQDKHIEFIRERVKNMTWKQISEAFCIEFGVKINAGALQGVANRRGIVTGRTGCFPKDNKPWNKGMKGIDLAGENGKKTQFKKGQAPINYRPIGSERITVDGYTEIKVADPKKWDLKHRVIWEKENGPVPKGYVVIFGDGDKQNITIDNLILVSRKQLVRLNQNNLIKDDIELTRTGVLIAEIQSKIGERKKIKPNTHLTENAKEEALWNG